jgi:sugar (pentulose or hexulose) kinase
MTLENTILALDCGTQSLRALLFDAEGDLLDKARIPYEPYFSEKPGWAEQDAEIFWKSACDACKHLNKSSPDLFRKIAGIGITTQRNTMVNVDEQGNPLRPAIIWLDQRKARQTYVPRGLTKLMYRAIGMQEAIRKVQMDGTCNWLRQFQRDVWEKTSKYLQVSGFLNYRLTSRFRDSIASQIGHVPMNYRKFRWCSKRELNAKLFPVEMKKLPELVPPGDQIGSVTKKAAEETGIARGTPVIACGSDKGCETIGMGVLRESVASLSFGTTATVQTTTKRYFEPLRFMPPYPAPIPGHYNPEVEIFRGYWMIAWFKNEFAYREVLQANELGIEPEEVLNDLLAQVPAGSMGLMVQPYWGPGLKNPSAKGAIIGFGDVHTRAHVYRAVIEGLGYALLDGLHNMERAGRFRAERVAVSGGASQSDQICQITADIFDLPLLRGKTYETSGLGAAIVTAVGLGIHPTFETAIDHMVKYDSAFEPNAKNVALYKELYRVYSKMYAALRPLYRQTRDIIGYPEKI